MNRPLEGHVGFGVGQRIAGQTLLKNPRASAVGYLAASQDNGSRGAFFPATVYTVRRPVRERAPLRLPPYRSPEASCPGTSDETQLP